MSHIDDKAPKKPRKVKSFRVDDQRVIFWMPSKGSGWKNEAVQYAIYRFEKGESIDLDDTRHLVALTRETFYELPASTAVPCVYVVTALDRMQNESKGVKVKIK